MAATKKFYTGGHSKQVGETNIDVCNRYPQAGAYYDENAVLWQIFRFDTDKQGRLTCEAKPMSGDKNDYPFVVEWIDGAPSDELLYKSK